MRVTLFLQVTLAKTVEVQDGLSDKEMVEAASQKLPDLKKDWDDVRPLKVKDRVTSYLKER